MANTKNLDRAGRKAAKRAARRQTKERYEALSFKERKGLRKHEGTLSQYLRELDAGDGE